MMQNSQFTCELCDREYPTSDQQKFDVHNCVAYICPTCSLISKNESQQERLIMMTKQKTRQNSNADMQQVHAQLSMLINVGFILLATTLTALVIANFEETVPFIYSIIKQWF